MFTLKWRDNNIPYGISFELWHSNKIVVEGLLHICNFRNFKDILIRGSTFQLEEDNTLIFTRKEYEYVEEFLADWPIYKANYKELLMALREHFTQIKAHVINGQIHFNIVVKNISKMIQAERIVDLVRNGLKYGFMFTLSWSY